MLSLLTPAWAAYPLLWPTVDKATPKDHTNAYKDGVRLTEVL